MTITDDTAAKLREAAEKATPGPWKHVTYMSGTQNVEYPGSKGITFSDQVIAADASAICYESDAQPLPFINISHRHEDKGSEVDPQRSLNAAYIALANPQTVLALLDQLAAKKARADAADHTIASLTEQLAEAREVMACVQARMKPLSFTQMSWLRKLAGHTEDALVHDALVMASDACELVACEIRQAASGEGEGR